MNATRRRLAIVAVAAALLVTTSAGCGVSTQERPQRIDPSDVPFGLLQARRPVVSVPAGATADLIVYFVGPAGLGTALRELRGIGTAKDALDALAAGPTQDEARAGLRSALVPRSISDVRVAAGQATVDLDPEFLQLGRTEQALALAQVVFTLTGLDAIDRVRFLVAGESLPVTVAGGRTTTAPIGRDQVVVPEVPRGG